jgi:hypothetical protein
VDCITKNFKILRIKKVNYQVRDPKAGHYERVNDTSSSIQRGKLIPSKRNCCFPKKLFGSRNVISGFPYFITDLCVDTEQAKLIRCITH